MKKYSTRIGGQVTSVDLPIALVAAYCTLLNTERREDGGLSISDHSFILSALNSLARNWRESTGKGFGKFVISAMLYAMIPPEDDARFQEAVNDLSR